MMKVWMKGIVTLGLLIGILWLSLLFYPIFFQPLPISKPQMFRVEPSTSAALFVRNLSTQHLITRPGVLLSLIRLNSLSSEIKAGVYQIMPGETPWHFLRRVIAGDVLMLSFRIQEGTTEEEISKSFLREPYLKAALLDWKSIAGKYPSAEGLLLADTYSYEALSQAQKILNQAHQNLQSYLQKVWDTRDDKLPYRDAYELLIAASIIEKEASLPEEKRLISGVIVNRLLKKMPLQMDPTVIYAKHHDFHGKLTHEDLSIDSPYNTYRYRGLPPTPIAMVGKDSIEAAAHPKTSNYLYFVAKGDGTHYFSVTYEEQKQAIQRFIKTH